MPVIGFLGGFAPSMKAEIELELAAFREGLRETGYVEGQNVVIEIRVERRPPRSASGVGGGPRPPQGRRDRDAGRRSSVVCGKSRDLDDPGRVPLRQRPGCGRPGVQPRPAGRQSHRRRLPSSRADAETAGAAAGAGSAGQGDCPAGNTGNSEAERVIRAMQAAARPKRVDIVSLKIRTEGELDGAFATLLQMKADGLVFHGPFRRPRSPRWPCAIEFRQLPSRAISPAPAACSATARASPTSTTSRAFTPERS